MDKKILILLFAILFFSCKKKNNQLEVISSYYKNLGDSILVISYKKNSTFEVFTSSAMKLPYYTSKEGRGFEKRFKKINDKMIIFSLSILLLGDREEVFDKFEDRNNLIKQGIVKEVDYAKDTRFLNARMSSKDAMVFIFKNKKSYIVLKESYYQGFYNETFHEMGSRSLSKKTTDSCIVKTATTLFKNNVIYHLDDD